MYSGQTVEHLLFGHDYESPGLKIHGRWGCHSGLNEQIEGIGTDGLRGELAHAGTGHDRAYHGLRAGIVGGRFGVRSAFAA